MVDVLKTLDIDYLAMNCASAFRGIHESFINYGKNTKPEILTCPHEEIAVHMAQGYAKIEGQPMAMMCHGTVGLQHASMALYNAWCDRVPVYVGGTLVLQPGLTQKEIADKVGIEGATLVPIIDKMEKEGLLKRKPDSSDRRINRIYLTPKADSLWESMIECALRIRKHSAKNISESDIQITLETLRKISKNLVAFS